MNSEKVFVLKQPLWKLAGGWLICVAFVITGISLIRIGNYAVGILCTAFFGLGVIVIPLKPRTLLIVDEEGITPTYSLPRNFRKKIPWNLIERIGIATERTFAGVTSQNAIPLFTKSRFLVLYLRDKDFLTKGFPTSSTVGENVFRVLQGSGLINLDDGGTGQVYIPAAVLPGWSIQKIVDHLNTLRPTTSTEQMRNDITAAAVIS